MRWTCSIIPCLHIKSNWSGLVLGLSSIISFSLTVIDFSILFAKNGCSIVVPENSLILLQHSTVILSLLFLLFGKFYMTCSIIRLSLSRSFSIIFPTPFTNFPSWLIKYIYLVLQKTCILHRVLNDCQFEDVEIHFQNISAFSLSVFVIRSSFHLLMVGICCWGFLNVLSLFTKKIPQIDFSTTPEKSCFLTWLELLGYNNLSILTLFIDFSSYNCRIILLVVS